MRYIPLYERILVQVREGVKQIDEFSLPDNARAEYLLGTVIAVGEGYRKENGQIAPLLVTVGKTVHFGPWAGTKVQVCGQEYLVMREGEIAGLVEA